MILGKVIYCRKALSGSNRCFQLYKARRGNRRIVLEIQSKLLLLVTTKFSSVTSVRVEDIIYIDHE